MKALFAFFILILPFASNTTKEGIPTLKKIIHVSKAEIRYIYKDKKIERTVIYQQKSGTTFTKFTTNKKVVLQLKSQKGKLLYKTSKTRKFKVIDKEFWEGMSKDSKVFFEAHRADQNEFNKPFNGGGEGKLPNGIAQTWSNEDAINNGPGQGANDDGCTQTGTCSCGSTTREVTCPCLKGIICQERSVKVCDTAPDGSEVNCRNVTVCVPMCV